MTRAKHVDPYTQVRTAQPRCFSDRQWAEWSKFATASAKPTVEDHACTDCLPEFKTQMVALGRCSWRTVKFVRIEDGPKSFGIEGRREPIKAHEVEIPGIGST
jgi:hypothetical protein